MSVTALSLYYGRERSLLHRVSTEPVFWALFWGWAAYILLLPDSPLQTLRPWRCEALERTALVLLSAALGMRMQARNYSKRMRSHIQRLDIRELATQYTETLAARVAVNRLERILSKRRSSLFDIVEFIRNRRSTSLGQEVYLALSLCCDAGPEQLLYALNSADVELPRLFEIAGTPEVVDLLRQQIPSMDVVTKAKLVDAMQRQSDFYCRRPLQELSAQLMVQTQASELTTLKSLLDEGGDWYNLHKLVFSDMAEDLREVVLDYVEVAGRRLRNSEHEEPVSPRKGMFQRVKVNRPFSVRKVLSDLDDTLVSSGGHFPAGADHRFPKGQLYPGILALFYELDVGHLESQNRHSGYPGNGSSSLASFGRSTWAFFGRGGSERNSVWLRMTDSEWTKVFLPGTESVNRLRGLLQEKRRAYDCTSMPAVICGAGGGGTGDVSFVPPSRRVMSNLVFLSARPHAYKDYSENSSYRLFKRLRSRNVIHCMPTLLPGRMRSSGSAAIRGLFIEFHRVFVLVLLAALLVVLVFASSTSASLCPWLLGYFVCGLPFLAASLWGSRLHRSGETSSWVWQPVGADKVQTFLEYQQLYSECTSVFFGDNGQGDLWCAEQLGLRKTGGEKGDSDEFQVEACFIHEVIPRSAQLSSLDRGLTQEEKEKEWEQRGIYFHFTYVGAAINAYEHGLISAEGLARVGTAAVEDMLRMWVEHNDSPHDWPALGAELNEDVQQANSLLPESIPRISLIPASFGSKQDLHLAMMRRKSVADFSFATPMRRRSSNNATFEVDG